ncbi:MAG: hypothetical protein PHI79_01205 [Sulfurovaceae bacterium]|nr:hypothetical protein [Sulfurovaceae bacterium]MDD5548197.1 hypothetical protein [Sulfurovaceae bacterium]
MCAEKVHKLMIAIILGVIMGIVAIGDLKLAFILQLILMLGFIMWALTGWCVSLAIFKKLLPPCDTDKKQD